MDRGRLPYHVDLYSEGGSWKLRMNEDLLNAQGFKEHRWREPVQIGPAIGPHKLSRKQAQRAVWEQLPEGRRQTDLTSPSGLVLADYVKQLFVPEHVAIKGLAGRTHYRAILKHVLTPEEVQSAFGAAGKNSRMRLKAIPDWPYLGGFKLAEIRPENVEKLVQAGLSQGYSIQTVTHIRNVVSAIFTHARKSGYFFGENPAAQVTTPGMTRKEAHVLTLEQTRAALQWMRYPEREMTLLVILTGMNVAEICGLQWQYVNLSDASVLVESETIPPRTISIKKQWYRGELGSVKIGRARNLPIPRLLHALLEDMSRRPRLTGADDFVLISEAGTPVNETNIASRRLKRIGGDLQMPWLSWHVFRRTRKDYLHRFGAQFEARIEAALEP